MNDTIRHDKDGGFTVIPEKVNIMDAINYEDVIELGFKREDMNDSVFEQKNGYGWFLVRKKLYKGILAEWDCETRTVKIVRYKKIDVKAKIEVEDLEELKKYIKFFTNK